MPPVHLAIEPAASIDDVVEALSKHQPLIVNFSGHGLNGSIAFELPDGRVELPAAKVPFATPPLTPGRSPGPHPEP